MNYALSGTELRICHPVLVVLGICAQTVDIILVTIVALVSHAQTTRSYIHHHLFCGGSSVHLADCHWEVKQPWQGKWYSTMNYGTLAP